MRKKSPKTALALAIIISLAGCAKFQARPLSPAQTASALENRALDNPDLKVFIETNLHRQLSSWPAHSWDFSMLTLAALYYHPDLDVARAKWQVAEAGKITAGQYPNPSISVPPGFIANPGAANPWLYGVSLDIPIETAGKRGYRLARAGHLADAAYLDIATASWRVRSRLRTALLNLYLSRESAALLKRQLAAQKALVQVLEARLAQGEIPRPELTQAQISLDQNRLLLQENKKQLAENRVRLAAALGLPVTALRQVEISYAFLQRLPRNPVSPEIRRHALLNRPDILAALASYEAAQSALQLEIAKQYPDLHLGPGYHFDDAENKWTFGLSLTLPVLNRNQGPIAEAKARRQEAAARFTALQARVIAEIDRTQAGYLETLRKLKTAEVLVAAEKAQEHAARRGLQAGEMDRLALLSARLKVDNAALSRLKAFYQAQQALGQLEDALNSPLGTAAVFPVALQMNPRHGENSP
jgi:cobalt-zinc-cadmium efflux system outer membrane protein